MAVGAALDAQGQLSPRDQLWLKATHEICRKLPISYAHNLQISIINVEQNEDFLNLPDDARADLVIICCVRNFHNMKEAIKFNNERFGQKMTSQRHFEPNSWGKAARQIGTTFVVTHATPYPDPYDPEGHEPEVTATMFAPEYECIYTQGNNIPVTWDALKDQGYDQRSASNLARWKRQLLPKQEAANLSDFDAVKILYNIYIGQRTANLMHADRTRLGAFLDNWRCYHSRTELLVRNNMRHIL